MHRSHPWKSSALFAAASFVLLQLPVWGCATEPGGATPASDPAGARAVEEAPRDEPAPGSGVASEPLSEQELRLGSAFQPLADQFAFTEYVGARRMRGGLVFDYLPEDATMESWTYRGTMRLIRVAAGWEEGEALLPKFVESLQRGRSNVLEIDTWEFPEGTVVFVDYELAGNHNLAVVWQVFPGFIGVFEAHRRGERFAPGQVGHFRQVARRVGRSQRGTEPGAPAP